MTNLAASLDEQIYAALEKLAKLANPYARVELDRKKPMGLESGGLFVVRRSDPGEPTIDLSPLTYNYFHEIPCEIAGFSSGELTHGQILDALLIPFGRAVEADRSLGGLVTFLSVTAADKSPIDATGTDTLPTATFSVIAEYATQHPLG